MNEKAEEEMLIKDSIEDKDEQILNELSNRKLTYFVEHLQK